MRVFSILIACVLGVVIAIAILAYLWTTGSNAQYPLPPFGGGRHLKSPDGKYEASASNLAQDIAPNNTRFYYRFEILDASRNVVAVYEIAQPPSGAIIFREGPGRIFWSNDSSSVSFGTPDNTLWTWHESE